jgi:hypothetical protein
MIKTILIMMAGLFTVVLTGWLSANIAIAAYGTGTDPGDYPLFVPAYATMIGSGFMGFLFGRLRP